MARGDWGWGFPKALIWSKTSDEDGFGEKVQFSCSIVSKSLGTRGLQHARPSYPLSIPGTCSNSCPSSWWCHPTISSSVVPVSSWLQSFPASGSIPVSQFFASGGQSIGTSASATVLSMYIQDWFPLELTGLISLQSRGLSTSQFKSINSCRLSFLYSLNSHILKWLLDASCIFTGKTIALTRWTFTSYSTKLNMNYSWFGNWRKRWP